ncbi:polysaccharide biosynthesis/export family protein [Sphingobium yanoikuyae]|uniref:polysaccharide biosynthesis/export family protein n=1 Tax=Sphingobium yanoikuyae TaxID=13690 RepID=UPI0035B10448
MQLTRFCRSSVSQATLLLTTTVALSACAGLPSSGPSTARVVEAGAPGKSTIPDIRIVDINDATIQQVAALHPPRTFLNVLGEGSPQGTVIGYGDTLDISIWEAPPSVLFGAASIGGATSSSGSKASQDTGLVGRSPGIPEQMVDKTGQIIVPFVGKVNAVGRTPVEIASEIEARLRGKAHLPQVVVRRLDNSTATVTVVGNVVNSRRVPLTPMGERLLDALASAGGTKEPVGKVTVQITRGNRVVAMPLEAVISDPVQNIRLAPNDVMTLLYQPYSFTALGAISKASEVSFEGTGMTLAQALGRIGGLDDQRSDPKGVFIFRMERTLAADNSAVLSTPRNDYSMVPVVYRINLKDPASFFLAQKFEIENRDVIFVSNSPSTDLQKFLGILSQAAFSVTGLGSVIDTSTK